MNLEHLQSNSTEHEDDEGENNVPFDNTNVGVYKTSAFGGKKIIYLQLSILATRGQHMCNRRPLFFIHFRKVTQLFEKGPGK